MYLILYETRSYIYVWNVWHFSSSVWLFLHWAEATECWATFTIKHTAEHCCVLAFISIDAQYIHTPYVNVQNICVALQVQAVLLAFPRCLSPRTALWNVWLLGIPHQRSLGSPHLRSQCRSLVRKLSHRINTPSGASSPSPPRRFTPARLKTHWAPMWECSPQAKGLQLWLCGWASWLVWWCCVLW